METTNAIIKSATIRIERGSFLVGWLTLSYGCYGQNFGGYALHRTKNCKHHQIKGLAGEWILRVLQIAGVESWDDIVGKTIRIKHTPKQVYAIDHIIKNDWFDQSEDLKDNN